MDPNAWKTRTCPKCGSDNYQFRSRKRIAAESGKPEATETKYRCKACSHEWQERVEVKGTPDAR
jgi:transposase-like protein